MFIILILIVLSNNHFSPYISDPGMNYSNVIGYMLVMVLLLQFISGILSSSYYNPFYSIPFDPVSYTMIDTNLGWLVRYYHMLGSSLFLLLPFLHWIRAVWLRLRVLNSLSFIWIPGRILFILSLIEGFSGHVSNRGQMFYTAAALSIGSCLIT